MHVRFEGVVLKMEVSDICFELIGGLRIRDGLCRVQQDAKRLREEHQVCSMSGTD